MKMYLLVSFFHPSPVLPIRQICLSVQHQQHNLQLKNLLRDSDFDEHNLENLMRKATIRKR